MTIPFLQVPPFPGSRGLPLIASGTSVFDGAEVVSALVRARVGGQFWSSQVDLPEGCEVVLVPDNQTQLAAMIGQLQDRKGAIIASPAMRVPAGYSVLKPRFDPWHLANQASEVWAGADVELATVTALSGKPVKIFKGEQPSVPQPDLVQALHKKLAASSYASPFDGEPWDLLQVIEQLGEWRQLIDSNRDYQAIFGVARWKRVTADPLLWGGSGAVPHARRIPTRLAPDKPVAAWKSRTPKQVLNRLEAAKVKIAELEDGMIRSVGLGANCVPPFSIFADRSGVYFDPNQPSDLENLLEYADFPAKWIERAKGLRASLAQAGISKYGQGKVTKSLGIAGKRCVLVTGQVEDDRSVLSGGGNCTNLELVIRARDLEPDAWIIYKPHPDVEAGHRKGHIPDAEVLRHADVIERDAPIAALIDQVDVLHVITSLAGFEALLRGKDVTTHGQPFYAGWGLTRDLGPANPRRTRKRSLDELVAATLIGYPRYVDPLTRLPCPPEVLIQRIVAGDAQVSSPLILFRELQGSVRLAWQRLMGAR